MVAAVQRLVVVVGSQAAVAGEVVAGWQAAKEGLAAAVSLLLLSQLV